MAAKVTGLALEVQGAVVRKFDGSVTTLMLTEEQAREAHESLGAVLSFFDSQSGDAKRAAALSGLAPNAEAAATGVRNV